jgi:hypothetical protein
MTGKTDTAFRKHADCIDALRLAREDHEKAKESFGELIGRQVRGEDVPEAVVLRAGTERDKAAAKLERAELALRAAEAALRDAEAADAAAATERGWVEASKIAENYRAEVRRLAALLKDVDASIDKILGLGLAIGTVSPAAKMRPDVTDLLPSKLRARMQRAVELSLPQLYGATAETRHTFPGLEPRLLESLGFYTLKTPVAAE